MLYANAHVDPAIRIPIPAAVSSLKNWETVTVSSETRKARNRKTVENPASYHSRGTGARPLSLLFFSRRAVSTGRRPDMAVDQSARNEPMGVTLGESHGMLMHAPKVSTNEAPRMGYEYVFFSMKYEKMMAGIGTRHLITWLTDSEMYTSDALFVTMLEENTTPNTRRANLLSTNCFQQMVRLTGTRSIRRFAPQKEANVFHIV
mmetsp:Transcript_20434/g.48471  ORF Transcript_20434/g.48471 Transcript_20434/m.48471 type:complete len:204 (-) Transcript_20434:297-908(-)